ncbi:MAG: hypothetical protein SGI71_03455 [Verrucomicrobiota bacterium]|nr:hypothetical protein [Verrucomicrobiota bacterium]
MDQTTYKPYKGLPMLGGVCTLEEASRPGLSVEESVKRLKHYHYALKRLHEIFTAHITSEPIYELKMGFSLHSHICAEHVASMRKRVSEMREPPLGLELVPDAHLEIFFDEILSATTTEELVAGLYHKAVPSLVDAMEVHLKQTNTLVDHPSVRILRFALLELKEVVEYGRKTVEALVSAEQQKSMGTWFQLLDDCLENSGGIDGRNDKSSKELVRKNSKLPFKFEPVPKRDERFPDPYNMGVNAETFLYNPDYPPQPKTLMMFYKRLREIDVPEMMASIIAETKNKPWGYYQDMTRQLWDEARHAMMGEVGFINSGVDWHKVMVNFTWSLNLNTQLKPMERHGVLYFIEQGLMPKTGKRFEWEVALASGNPLSGLFQDYDWADEVLHARVGRDWYVSEFKDSSEAIEFGDKCWSKVLSDWNAWKTQGLTQHRNWWPEVYTEACERWGTQPDPTILAYNETYENKRADLKSISASG